MATDGRDDAVEGSWSPKRPKTAAEERVARQSDASTTQELASDIEKTRQELAQTLDAIADRVSPKKVAQRTSDQVRVSVKEGVAKGQVAMKAGAASAAESAKGAVEAAKEMVSGNGGAVPAAAAPPPAVAPTPGALADASQAPVAAPYGAEVPTYYAPAPSTSKAPVIAGVGAAVLVLLLVLRRRRRRR